MDSTINPAMELALSASFGSISGWRSDALNLIRQDAAHAVAVQLRFDTNKGRLSHQRLLGRDVDNPSEPQVAATLFTVGVDLKSSIEEALDGVDWGSVYVRYQTVDAWQRAGLPLVNKLSV